MPRSARERARERSPALRLALVSLGLAACGAGCCGCRRGDGQGRGDAGAFSSAPDASPKPGAPRAGMVWIPPGTLRAGTPEDRTPRVAPEELPGTPIEMQGFYIDLFPYPNEPGAIPQPNVSRDEAARLCEGKGKRLCTELEWERACKGPDNTVYEYGDSYRASACLTGQKVELSSRKPSGERPSCRSGFGVMDMHGGAWEWTESSWDRGTHGGTLGVLRGGNALAGEIVGRCANAIGRPVAKKQPTFGFRCCGGDRNGARVNLEPRLLGKTMTLLVKPEERAAPFLPLLDVGAWGGDIGHIEVDRAWIWQPIGNEELLVFGGCTPEGPGRRCGFVVGRMVGGTKPTVLVQAIFPRALAEMKTTGEATKLHTIAFDIKGRYFREISYSYGKVDLGEPVRLGSL